MSLNTTPWTEDRCPRCLSFDIRHSDFEKFSNLDAGMRKGVCTNCGLTFSRIYDIKNEVKDYRYTEWNGQHPDIRRPEIKPFPLVSRGGFTLEEFENAKYDLAERVRQRDEEADKYRIGIYEKAAQLGIIWIPFEKKAPWYKFWEPSESYVKIVDSRREYKDGTFYEQDCKEEQLFSHLRAFVEM